MATVPTYDHIVVVVEENHNFDEIIGNTVQAPFINALAGGGASLAGMAAETHPSQPNYFALYAGTTFGTADDGVYSEPDPTIATILQAAGKTFKGYVDQPGLSDFNHDPWVSFPEGRTVQKNITTFPALFPSGDYSGLPSVSFVIPGVNNDMHNGTIQDGDAWLQANLSQYAAWATTHNSLLIVTWDENDDERPGAIDEEGNAIPTILYGAHVVAGTYETDYDHYNLLSMIAAANGVTGPNNAATANPVQVFAGRTISTAVSGTVVLGINDDPLLVTSTGSVTVTGSGLDGVDGSAHTLWAVENDGAIASSSGNGLYFAGGGTVTNTAGASLSGGVDGVFITGDDDAGVVFNAGTIAGTQYGVFLSSTSVPFVYGASAGATNKVTNSTGGTIRGGTYAIYFRNSGTITNSGSLVGSNADGVVLAAGGTITNTAGGSIAGASSGVLVLGAAATISNSGSVTGGAAGGYGLALTAGGTVTNAGTISGLDGIGLRAGGSVTNAATGSVAATGASGVGVFFGAAPASLTNAGQVTGNALGALLSGGGAVTNTTGGVVTGASAGIEISGAAGTVVNTGTIKATAAAGTGLDLERGGTLTNNAGGQITGGGYGLYATGATGTVGNDGGITGTTGIGLFLAAAGTITSTGSITGATAGVFTKGGASSLTNAGIVTATASGGAGADIEAGGSVGNAATGVIKGGAFGVFVTGGSGSVTNAGSITGTGSAGVGLGLGGTVTNMAAATISGGSSGVTMGGAAATLSNAGSIAATASGGAGVDAEAGGTITNAAGGSISGALGVFITGGNSTVTNAGTITGSSYAVDFAGSGTNRLIVAPGAVFNGAVAGGNGTLELAAAPAAGTIGGIGGVAFGGFATLAVDSGATWTLTGSNSIATLRDDGVATVNGTLQVTAAIDSASGGVLQVAGGGALELAAAAGTGPQLAFLGAGRITIDDTAAFGAGVGTTAYTGPQIQGFAGGAAIDLKTFAAGGAAMSYDAGSGLLQLSNAALQVATLSFQTGTLGGGSFQVASDGGSGLLLTRA